MEPCNNDIFKNGHSIGVLDACMHRAETFVQAVAKDSGQQVDWHYSGGRANVLYIGDHAKVFASFQKLATMLSEGMTRELGECGSCDGGHHRMGHVLAVYPPDAHGPYRHGDPLPDGVIAVG